MYRFFTSIFTIYNSVIFTIFTIFTICTRYLQCSLTSGRLQRYVQVLYKYIYNLQFSYIYNIYNIYNMYKVFTVFIDIRKITTQCTGYLQVYLQFTIQLYLQYLQYVQGIYSVELNNK